MLCRTGESNALHNNDRNAGDNRVGVAGTAAAHQLLLPECLKRILEGSRGCVCAGRCLEERGGEGRGGEGRGEDQSKNKSCCVNAGSMIRINLIG